MNLNLTNLPDPKVFYTIDYEQELSALESDFIAKNPDYAALTLESDPIKKLLELAAYRTVLYKNEVNEKLKQTMLAFATKSNLDQIAANTVTSRLIIDEGDPTANPPIPPTYEDDEALRFRAQNAPETWTVAGPKKAYEFFARKVSGNIRDVKVLAHTPKAGDVSLYVITHDNNGEPSDELLSEIEHYLSDEERRPLNDSIFVNSAEFKDIDIALTITYYAGQDKERINAEIEERLLTLVDSTFKISEELTLSAINKTAKISGVQNVKHQSPATDITPKTHEVIRVNSIELLDGGIYEHE